jgi:short-subunit dehydrogenase
VKNGQQIIVITGATAGVGRATAHAFAEEGAYVVLLARDEKRLRETEMEVIRRGGKTLAIPTDVANAAEVEQAAEQAERTVGPIDVWVNNAMATIFSPIQEITPDEFKRATEVTYLGAVYGTMSALKRMRPRNDGVIIQIGSALAYRSIPLQSAYCGAKHALHGFTDSVRSELLHDRSRVKISMVQLPGVNTPQFEWCRTTMGRHPQPVGPVYQPEVAARAIVWAAKHKRREIYVGWPAAVTIVLNKWLPGFFDKYLANHAYEQQFTSQRISANRPDNLFQPVSTPYRTHGSFEDRAHQVSPQLWLSLHRNAVTGFLALSAAAAISIYQRRSRQH